MIGSNPGVIGLASLAHLFATGYTVQSQGLHAASKDADSLTQQEQDEPKRGDQQMHKHLAQQCGTRRTLQDPSMAMSVVEEMQAGCASCGGGSGTLQGELSSTNSDSTACRR
ncbi:hypothetical protein IAQ61_005686 [Plenodomus lingam]|uniref:uncharacterized protein n=1 Tax=Leptosphaeria maculans TaxID=5022 RepID=UPI003327CF05|nr:hypothetical protein IAQ61_005686 [Plenodomus lingam]